MGCGMARLTNDKALGQALRDCRSGAYGMDRPRLCRTRLERIYDPSATRSCSMNPSILCVSMKDVCACPRTSQSPK